VKPERHLMTGFGTPMGNRATGPLVDRLQAVVLAIWLRCYLPVLQEVAMPAMPAVAVAASGRARALSSRLNLVAWLVVGADEEISGGVAPIAASRSWRVDPRPRRAVQEGLGRAHRDPPRCRWPPASSALIGHWATPGCI
jgi:hypothetical protein